MALPSSCEKVDATVRDAVAASLGIEGIVLPFEGSKDAPGRSTPESMRIYLAKYVLPAYPALAAVWHRLLLAPEISEGAEDFFEEPQEAVIRPKSYAANFAFNRIKR